MTAWALAAFNLALFVAMIGLLLYGRPYLALVASVLGAVGGVAYGIIAHFPLGIALGIVNIPVVAVVLVVEPQTAKASQQGHRGRIPAAAGRPGAQGAPAAGHPARLVAVAVAVTALAATSSVTTAPQAGPRRK